MNVLVLDESLELAEVVGRFTLLRGWQPHFIGSLDELELGLRAYGRPALVIVNLQAPLTAWEVGQRLRGLEGESPVVVLVVLHFPWVCSDHQFRLTQTSNICETQTTPARLKPNTPQPPTYFTFK